MDLGLLAAFWAVSMLFVMTPGADWAYAISAGIRQPNVLPSVSGLLAGHVAATLAVAAGIAAVLAGAPVLLAAITVAGATYLVWLGVGALRDPATPYSDEPSSTRVPVARQVLRGFGVSGLNPKVFLLFIALMPQFTDPSADWPVPVQVLALGLVHLVNCAVVYLGVGVGARLVLRARPAAARLVGRFSGAAMVAIGSVLLVHQVTP